MTRWRVSVLAAAVAAACLAGVLGGSSCLLSMPGRSFKGPLPPLTPDESTRAATLARHIEALAVTIGERNVDYAPAELAAAERYVTKQLEAAGHTVRREPYVVQGVEVANLVAELPGTSEIVLVGAHYDSAPGTPGADDNASGTAALLVLAAELRDNAHTRTVRFVAFTNEEPPWFHGPDMGARHNARGARERGDDIVAMLSLETLAYYVDEPHSQHYPAPFGLLYPHTGDFVGFIGNPASRKLVRRAVRVFRERTDFPSQGAALPASIPGVDWSDHRAFWEQGYPALMVTDTAPNRNPHYHRRTDLPDVIDVERLSRVVSGLREVIIDLGQ